MGMVGREGVGVCWLQYLKNRAYLVDIRRGFCIYNIENIFKNQFVQEKYTCTVLRHNIVLSCFSGFIT